MWKPPQADDRGNIAVLTALLLPLLLLVVGAAVDLQRWGQQRAALQDFADALALRGAREFMLANAEAAQVEALVQSLAVSGFADDFNVAPSSLTVSANKDDAVVSIVIKEPPLKGAILTKFSPYKDEIVVASNAVARGGMDVCVVILEESAGAALSLKDDGRIDAAPCSVLSNSSASDGLKASGASKVIATMICSAGGASGGAANFDPSATTDCPVYPDPLAGRAAPPVGACDFLDTLVGNLVGAGGDPIPYTMSPGVYCGGLKIESDADVTFEPGIYVIKDGELKVGENSTLRGENIGFYLVGDTSTFRFEAGASVDMSAPKDGLMSGLLFFEDRGAPVGRQHVISSADARRFLGTFYLPQGALRIDADAPVADASAYTAIVARELEILNFASLVLNANYGMTDVPPPPGVGPVAGEVFLRD